VNTLYDSSKAAVVIPISKNLSAAYIGFTR